jgi:hypothetical protein
LESAVDCDGGDRPYLTVERSDPDDGTSDRLGEDGEPEGWPW